jgi:hypothetical protein
VSKVPAARGRKSRRVESGARKKRRSRDPLLCYPGAGLTNAAEFFKIRNRCEYKKKCREFWNLNSKLFKK